MNTIVFLFKVIVGNTYQNIQMEIILVEDNSGKDKS